MTFTNTPRLTTDVQVMVHRGDYAVLKVTLTRKLVGSFNQTRVLYFNAQKPQPRADHLEQFPELLDNDTGMWDNVAVANWNYYESVGDPISESQAYARFLTLSEALSNIYGG